MPKATIEKPKEDVITVHARKGDKFFIAECKELGVYTQGETWEELERNIREAVELSLEDEELRDKKKKKILISYHEYLQAK